MEYVAYHRVSTKRQEQSGLSLEAQQTAVNEFVSRQGGQLVGSFTEAESGARNDRPALAQAMELCRKHKAILAIAKLDRLSRNVHFISGLMESGVEFVAVDMPTANRLTLHIMAAFAEHEREIISRRIKDALKAARARGQKQGYGNPNSEPHQRIKAERRLAAEAFAQSVMPYIQDAQKAGAGSLRQIAAALTSQGIATSHGRAWTAQAVKLAIARLN